VTKSSTVILLGYMAVLLLLSAVPGPTGVEDQGNLLALVSPGLQNFLHMPAYGVLALLWIAVLRRRGIPPPWTYGLALLLAAGYGVVLEFVQLWVPGRYPSVTDGLLDIAGILLFGGLSWLARLLREAHAA
jgi:VanZ family protein